MNFSASAAQHKSVFKWERAGTISPFQYEPSNFVTLTEHWRIVDGKTHRQADNLSSAVIESDEI